MSKFLQRPLVDPARVYLQPTCFGKPISELPAKRAVAQWEGIDTITYTAVWDHPNPRRFWEIWKPSRPIKITGLIASNDETVREKEVYPAYLNPRSAITLTYSVHLS